MIYSAIIMGRVKFEQSNRLQKLPGYVFAQVVAATTKARRSGEDIIDLGMGNPDQPTPPLILEKMRQVALDPKLHRYSLSRGIDGLRKAVCRWYARRYGVKLDPEKEALSVIGSKEGISHLALALLNEGDTALVPNPSYPPHIYSVVLAGCNVMNIPMTGGEILVSDLEAIYKKSWPRPRVLYLSYPHNPTTAVVEQDFFKDVVKFAKRNDIIVVHDLAYADIVFDGYQAPSFLATPGAKSVGMEFVSLSKSFNMAGWRVGFAAGNQALIGALTRIKSYLDYGIFAPLQVAAVTALDNSEKLVPPVALIYQKRRDVLVEGLRRLGCPVQLPKGTMYLWWRIPDAYQKLGSVKFALKLLDQAKVTVSPGLGFGELGEGYVRIALVENELRIKQALRGIGKMFKKDGLVKK